MWSEPENKNTHKSHKGNSMETLKPRHDRYKEKYLRKHYEIKKSRNRNDRSRGNRIKIQINPTKNPT